MNSIQGLTNWNANIDTKNGIRFGVIAQNSVDPWCLDPNYEGWEDSRVEEIREEMEEVYHPFLKFLEENALGGNFDLPTEDEIMEDLLLNYETDFSTYVFKTEDYMIEASETTLIVIKSPYYTGTRLCSPCYPNAGNLNEYDNAGFETYCLGPEWFEDDKPPYVVYRVDDNSIVYTPEKDIEEDD